MNSTGEASEAGSTLGAGEATLAGDAAVASREEFAALLPGQAVGRYVVLERAGAGAHAVVYAAYDPQLDRKVALKLLTRAAGDSDERLREARALGRLSHPNVVTIHDVGELGSAMFLAMEFVAGRTLRALIDGGTAEDELLRVFIDAGRGLQAAHQLGIVHGDFKPANVVIGSDGRARVLDFGLATMRGSLAADPATSSTTTRISGTPAYMAPERFGGAPATIASDVFAYCASLYEALAGARPFAGTSAAELAYAVHHDEPPPLPRRVRASLRRVVLAGLTRDAAARPAGMAPILAALQPTRGRARLLGAAGAAIAAVVLWRATATAPDPCADADVALREVFDSAGRERLRKHIASAEDAELLRVAPQVEVRLERAVEQTRAGLREVCALEYRSPLERPPLLVERHRCLDVRSAALTQLLDSLERADARHLGAAPAIVEATTRDLECGELIDPLLTSPATDADTRRIAAAVLELAWARTEARAGYLDAVTPRIARARADFADLPLLGPRLDLLEAREFVTQDVVERGSQRSREATWAALAQRDTATALRGIFLSTSLAIDGGAASSRRDGEAVVVLLELAQAIIAGFAQSRALQLDLALAQASLAAAERDNARARASFERAAESVDPTRATDVAALVQLDATLLINEGRFLDAWRAGAETAALQRFLYGNDYPLAGIYDRIAAVAMTRVGLRDRGRALLEHAAAALHRHFGRGSRPVLLVLGNLCSARRDSGDLRAAADCFAEVAQAAAHRGGDRAVMSARRGLASVWTLEGLDLPATLMLQLVMIDERDIARRIATAADLADLWRRRGLLALAEATLRRVLSEAPDASLPMRQYAEAVLVDVLLDRGDLDAAAPLVDRALAGDTLHRGAFISQRGRIHAQRGELAAALTDLEDAAQRFPSDDVSGIGWSGPTWFALAKLRARLDPTDPRAREIGEIALAGFRRAPGFTPEAAQVQQFLDQLPLPRAATPAR